MKKNTVTQIDSGCNVNIFGDEPAIVRKKKFVRTFV